MASPTKNSEDPVEHKTPSKDKDRYDLSGYYHLIKSPTNSSEKVAFTIQGKRKSHRVLCYVPDKLTHLEDGAAIKVVGCKESSKTRDFFMSSSSVIEKAAPLDFDCIDKSNLTIDMLPKLAVADLLTVTAEVKIVQPAKTVAGNLLVQDFSVSDATGAVRAALWNTFVNSCQKGVTFKFVNLCLLVEKMEHYLYNRRKKMEKKIHFISFHFKKNPK